MAALLTAQGITKTYGSRTLFTGVAIGLEDRERFALIGPNGSGKSTLLKILAGLEHPDDDRPGVGVTFRRGARIAYVSQSDRFPEASTVLSAVVRALHDDPPPHLHDDHEIELAAEMTLARVGFENLAQHTESLSGGQRKRLAIARELARAPDVLLLDEPTNHLDVEGIEWLEEILRQGGAAAPASIVVTHDRVFLESIATRIVELSSAYPGGTFSVRGNYSEFLRRKGEFLDGQARQEQSLANLVREDIRWLSRGAQARRTKAKSRAASAHERIDELDVLRARNVPAKAAGIDFTSTDRMTHKLLVARAITKSLGGKRLFTDLDLVLSPGDKLGLMGPNGSGKSSLIRVLMSEVEPDPPTDEAVRAARDAVNLPSGTPAPGTIRRAESLRVVVFSQARTELDPSVSLAETLSPHADSVIYRGRVVHINTWAGRFLFTKDQLKNPVRALSGGEQARVHIARLMLEPADVLVLDEPTNDLDIPSLEVLEESLEDFPGAIILVTHDRAMIGRLATKILALDGQGNSRYFADYDQWEARGPDVTAKTPPMPAPVESRASGETSPPARKKLSYKEQQELGAIEEKIHLAEAQAREAEVAMSDSDVIADHRRMAAACRHHAEAQIRVAALYERWAQLESQS